ncbi:Oligopeptide transport system permease protein oppB [Mycoplasmopsis californica]|uniref:ABC transporter permease n=1 Tax=Mycoplasmopsis equigenitalium TaxID=114883 RepID=A0ABY5J147_9BACT|nr:ABC transporter permease [Mycoplasmopsis equigenitalium]UUD36973.1 ABC transporter permease [Mycoplasmopsis equigenitalium]VEU69731.1 Oligopeptide transport system permease protein oppB [Mycoplasmopsis californica]
MEKNNNINNERLYSSFNKKTKVTNLVLYREEKKKAGFVSSLRHSVGASLFKKTLKMVAEFLIISWIVITITFFLINSVPGSSGLTSGLNEASKKAIEHRYGLDLPLFQRYLRYLVGIVRFDFGISLVMFPSVEINDFIWVKFGKSFLVGIFSVFLTLLVGIPLGIWIGKNPGGFLDNFSTVIISIISSIPSLVLALLLLFLGSKLNMPTMFDPANIITYILPGLALSMASTITYIKYLRTELNRELNSMHAKFAYLKGVSKSRFVWVHALKPALFPIATFFPGVVLGSFLGSLFIEKVYFISGSGSTMIDAIQSKDYNVVLFMIIMYSVLIILSYTLRDALYEVLDPRVRRGGK